MLIASIPYRNNLDAIQQIALAHNADAIELRLDYAAYLDIQDIAALRNNITIPIVFTLRKKSQGGYYPFDEKTRLNTLIALSELKPDYMDVENDTSFDILETLSLNTRLICSYHNEDDTPSDLHQILLSLQHPIFHAYKIATHTHTVLDALRLLQFKYQHQNNKLTIIGMGEHGQCTRLLSPVIGNFMHYASITNENSTAIGQLTVDELTQTYGIKRHNVKTRLYALLGNPVNKSVGHILHNAAFSYLEQNAIYIKLTVTPPELTRAIALCRTLPFSGFSITQPLKECIVPELDKIDSESQPIQAINTITIKNNQWMGSNTDGPGAWHALQLYCRAAQTIVILGAGGAAKAIAHTLAQHDVKVIILNRTIDTAKQLADRVKGQYDTLSALKSLKNKYDAIINTIPDYHSLESEDLSFGVFAMDIVYHPIQTTFLKKAEKAGCIIIPGYKMYIEQALMQLQLWFTISLVELNAIKNHMELFFNKEALEKHVESS